MMQQGKMISGVVSYDHFQNLDLMLRHYPGPGDIWFGANLLSQALYLGFYGEPYDANQILKSLGTWYWVCVMIELVIWLIFGSLLVQKFKLDTSNGPTAESA